jgi:YegS/Rv2252/BmrU family lipid kinase
MTVTETAAASDQAMDSQQDDEQKCVSIIFNPVSGTHAPEQRKRLISEALARHGYTCQYIETSEEQGAKALAEKAVAGGCDLMAVSGGDGTVMEVLSALVGTDLPVAVLPSGTGNLLSINLGIPTSLPEAVDVALSGKPYALDLGKTDDGRFFAILGGIGLDARMIRDANRRAKKRLGIFAYLWAVLKNLPHRHTRVTITLEGKPSFRRHAKSVVVANMGKITGGLEAVPTASPNDGLLDVGVLKAETLHQWLRLLFYALLGRTQEAPDFDVYQTRHVVLKTKHPIPVEFDGEDAGLTRHLTVEVVPRAVHILLPEGAPATRDAQSDPIQVARRGLAPVLVTLGIVAALVVWLRRRR